MAPFQLAQERHKSADDDDLVAGTYLGRVERIYTEAQFGLRMRPATPAGIGERVHRGDADGAADAVITQRLLGKIARGAAAQFARKRHGHSRCRTTYRLGDRLDRRRAGSGNAIAELNPREEQANNRALDRKSV